MIPDSICEILKNEANVNINVNGIEGRGPVMAHRVWIKPEPDLESVEEYYGLSPEEWTGSLTDKVGRIMSKDDPHRDEYVNTLLRDEAYALTTGVNFCRDVHYAGDPALVQQSMSEEIDLIRYDGADLRSAVEEVSWDGAVLTEDTLHALRRADWVHTDVICDAEWYLSEGEEKTAVLDALDDARSVFSRTCDEARKTTEARLYYRGVEEAKQRDREQRQKVGASREPVLVGDVIKDWMRSMGRDESGRPIEQADKEQGVAAPVAAQAAIPQRQQRPIRAADRWSEPSVTMMPVADDGFEL